MKVKQEIIEKINTPAMRTKIAVALDTGEQNVYLAIKANTPDGIMTKMNFLMAIGSVLKIPVTKILEQEVEETPTK